MVQGPNDKFGQSYERDQCEDPLAARHGFGRHDRGLAGDVDADANDGGHRSADEIRADIERTRAEMDVTVDALQECLAPREVVHRTLEAIREHAGGAIKSCAAATGRKAWQITRDNPLPVATIAIGVTWLLLHKRKTKTAAFGFAEDDFESTGFESGSYADEEFDEFEMQAHYGESCVIPESALGASQVTESTAGASTGRPRRIAHGVRNVKNKVKDIGSHAAESVQNIGSQTMERVHRMGDYVRDKTSDLGGQVKHSARAATDWFGQTLDEYPLAVGAAIFAIGLAGGLAVPSTRPERKFMGPTRDKLMNQAQEVGSQLIDKGQEAAQKAVGAVKEAVASSAGGTETSSSTKSDQPAI